MPSIPELPAVTVHQTLHHESNDTSGALSKAVNKSKVYPSEEFVQSENCDELIKEKNLPVEKGDPKREALTPAKSASLLRKLFGEHFLILIVVFVVLVGALTAATIYYILSKQHRPELVYINMIWRHGDRAPTHFFPNFTEKYMFAFPRGIGNLTETGAKQTQKLGWLLRQRYFRRKIITPEQIYVRSTDVRRTIESAQNVLKGMHLTSVPVHVEIKTNADTAGNPYFYCPRAKQHVLDYNESYFLRENFSEVYEVLQRELNFNNDSYLVFDTICCLKAHDLELPEWMNDENLFQKLKFLSWNGVEASFGLNAYSDEVQKMLRGGSVLRAIVGRIACKVNYTEWAPVETCEEDFYGLSAHDMTIAALLSTFSDIYAILGEVPEIGFGANIAFEIWRSDNSYKLKVLYANRWDEAPQEITRFAPGCEDVTGFCDVIKFINQSRPLFFDNIDEQCTMNVTNLSLHDIIKRSAEYAGQETTDGYFDLIELF